MGEIMLQEVVEGLISHLGEKVDLDYSQGKKQLLVSLEGIFSLKPPEAVQILDDLIENGYLTYTGERETKLDDIEGLVESFQPSGAHVDLKPAGYWNIVKKG